MKPILDTAMQDRALQVFRTVFGADDQICTDWLRNIEGIVVPVVTDDLSLDEWASLLSDLCHASRTATIYAKSFVEYSDGVSMYHTTADAASILMLEQAWRPFRHGVSSPDARIAAAIYPPEGFGFLAGPVNTIEVSIKGKLGQFHSQFTQWVGKFDPGSQANQYLSSIARRYGVPIR